MTRRRTVSTAVETICALVLLATLLCPVIEGVNIFRGTGPLFLDSFHVRSFTSHDYDEMLNSTDEVWLIDFYAPWCPHCRDFAPDYEKIGELYADSPNVHVGAVDCTRNGDICRREQVHKYPGLKIFHAPKTATEPVELVSTQKRTMKRIVKWLEETLHERDMTTGLEPDELEMQLELLRNDRIADGHNGPGVPREQSMLKKYMRIRDAGAAAAFTIESGFFLGHSVLEGERYEAALKWVDALAASFPLQINRIAFANLADSMRRSDRWEQTAWQSLVDKWKIITHRTSFPKNLLTSHEEEGWAHCTTYTCGLWTLFHSMSVSDHADVFPVEPMKPSDIARAIRLFVMHFFGCAECVGHFLKANPLTVMDALAASDNDGPQEVILWLWRMHAKVNKVTKKPFWPSVKECSRCFADHVQELSLDPALLHEHELTAYIRSVYHQDDTEIYSMDAATNGMMSAMVTSLQGFASSMLTIAGVAICVVGLYTQKDRFVKKRQHAA